jgi:hypothetical protein
MAATLKRQIHNGFVQNDEPPTSSGRHEKGCLYSGHSLILGSSCILRSVNLFWLGGAVAVAHRLFDDFKTAFRCPAGYVFACLSVLILDFIVYGASPMILTV